ncbi:MAG: tetratricopeptide repeat protein, partial [Planctomycetota bacterium]
PSIYTLPDASERQLEPGPGCWIDAEGRYRFPNANWLSQVILAAAWRVGGISGVCVLSAVLVCAVFGLSAVVMRRLGVGWPMITAGALTAAMSSTTRLIGRPELFGYLALMGQFAILTGAYRVNGPKTISRNAALGVIALQALLVNLHSYFLLGLALSGPLVIQNLLGYLWAARTNNPRRSDWGRSARSAATLLAAQVAACFANPWTWRLAALPIQTVVYLQAQGITRGRGDHPWTKIGELKTVFAMSTYQMTPHQIAMIVLLALSILAIMAALAMRRLDFALLVGGMLFVGMSVRRNHAVAALLLTPAALAALGPPVRWLLARILARTRDALILAACTSAVAFATVQSVRVVRSDYYYESGENDRFGIGVSRLVLPVGAAEFVNEHLSDRRLWCDFASSSYLYHFAGARRALPILSNGWAYPPQLFAETIEFSWGQRQPADLIGQYRAEAVVLDLEESTMLFRQLLGTNDWSLVHAEGIHVVLIHHRGELSGLARQLRWDPTAEPIDTFIERVEAIDPVPTSALLATAEVLQTAGWPDRAIALSRRAIARRPGDARTWTCLGTCWWGRGLMRQRDGDPDYLVDWFTAARYYRKAIKVDPSYRRAKTYLNKLTEWIVAARRGPTRPAP